MMKTEENTIGAPMSPNSDIENINNESFKWTYSAVKSLIESYDTEKENFRDSKVKRNVLWCKIAEKLKAKGYNVSEHLCDRKFRNLKVTYKSIKHKTRKSGRGGQHWDYFQLMDHIFEDDETLSTSMPTTSAASVNKSKPALRSTSKLKTPSSSPSTAERPPTVLFGSLFVDEYRKRILDLEEKKLAELKSIRETYLRIAEAMEERNNLIRKYCSKI